MQPRGAMCSGQVLPEVSPAAHSRHLGATGGHPHNCAQVSPCPQQSLPPRGCAFLGALPLEPPRLRGCRSGQSGCGMLSLGEGRREDKAAEGRQVTVTRATPTHPRHPQSARGAGLRYDRPPEPPPPSARATFRAGGSLGQVGIRDGRAGASSHVVTESGWNPAACSRQRRGKPPKKGGVSSGGRGHGPGLPDLGQMGLAAGTGAIRSSGPLDEKSGGACSLRVGDNSPGSLVNPAPSPHQEGAEKLLEAHTPEAGKHQEAGQAQHFLQEPHDGGGGGAVTAHHWRPD